MLYTISWFLVLTLFAIWSIGVWGLHSFAVWLTSGVGAMDLSQPVAHLALPAWLAPWVPPELMLAIQASSTAVVPWIESVLSALPSATGWLSPLAWLLWGVGFVTLALGGVALHALISMTRKAARR